MAELEKLLEAIQEEWRLKEQQLSQETSQKLQEIKERKEEEAKITCEALEKKYKKYLVAEKEKALSRRNFEKRKAILEMKQHLTREILVEILDSIEHLDSEVYFEMVLHMIERYAWNEEGYIVFSKRDQERLPKDFDKKIQEKLKERPNAKLHYSAEAKQIKGGFILVYDTIEENCSFDRLIEGEKERWYYTISHYLFDA